MKRSTQRLGVGAVATLDEERSDDRGNHADECDSDREHEQLDDAFTAGVLGCEPTSHRKGGQGNGSDDRAGVRLEEVGTHTGDVADVVADVVGDGGRVAGVVLGDTGFDLADEVGAHIGSLGVDAATDTGEEGDGGGAEAVGRDDLEGRVGLEPFNKDQVHQHQAGEGKAGDSEAHHGATAERDREGLTRALLCCFCGAGVGHRRDGHAGVAGGRRQHRTDDVAHRCKRRDHDCDQDQHRHSECGDPGVLLLEERPGALLDLRHQEHHAVVPRRCRLDGLVVVGGQTQARQGRDQGQIRNSAHGFSPVDARRAHGHRVRGRREPTEPSRGRQAPSLDSGDVLRRASRTARADEAAADDHLNVGGPVDGPDAVAELANPGATGAARGARMRPWMSPTHFGSSDSRTLPTGATSALPTGGRSCGPTLTQADRLAQQRRSTRPSTCCARSAMMVSGRYPLECQRHQAALRLAHDRHHPTNWLPTMILSSCSSGWRTRHTTSVRSCSSIRMTACSR